MRLLRDNHREANLESVMCRSLISVDWRGFVYDCDFNQMLHLPMALPGKARPRLRDLAGVRLDGLPIVVKELDKVAKSSHVVLYFGCGVTELRGKQKIDEKPRLTKDPEFDTYWQVWQGKTPLNTPMEDVKKMKYDPAQPMPLEPIYKLMKQRPNTWYVDFCGITYAWTALMQVPAGYRFRDQYQLSLNGKTDTIEIWRNDPSEGRDLSLDNIEHDILRATWKDVRIHYAVNCASFGCPNLAREAYTGARLEPMLEAAARAYVNHPRGFGGKRGRVVASSIYDWYRADWGSVEAVLDHARKYAEGPTAKLLEGADSIAAYDYNWNLNAA